MRIWTYEELRRKVERDLDLEDELFVSPAEMMGYANEAIEEAEAEIIKIHEDYLLTRAPVSLVTGQATYALPTNIYAAKIRGMEFQNGTIFYPVRRIRQKNKFDRIQSSGFLPSETQDYAYYPVNDSAEGGQKITLVPPAWETTAVGISSISVANPGVFTKLAHGLSVGEEIFLWSSGTLPTGLINGRVYMVATVPSVDTFTVKDAPSGSGVETTAAGSGVHYYEKFPFRITLWFIRTANRMTEDADVLDIPQFANFITQFMKKRCYEKEPGHPNLAGSIMDLERQRNLMVDTLTEMVPDEDNEIQGDFTHYSEHS